MKDIYRAPLRCHVLVYPIHSSRWERKFTLLDRDGETCTIIMPDPSGLIKFRSTVVKPYLQPAGEGISSAPVTQYENTGPLVFLAKFQYNTQPNELNDYPDILLEIRALLCNQNSISSHSFQSCKLSKLMSILTE